MYREGRSGSENEMLSFLLMICANSQQVGHIFLVTPMLIAYRSKSGFELSQIDQVKAHQFRFARLE